MVFVGSALKTLLLSLAKLCGVIVMAVVVFALVSTTALSYFTVQTLTNISANPNADHNIKEVSRLGQKYILEIEQFEQISADIQKRKSPPLCSTLCNASALDHERFLNERGEYLQSFYKTQKASALQDPSFRMKMEELGFFNKAFPKSMRMIMTDIWNAPTGTSNFKLALRLEGVVLSEMTGIKTHWAQIQSESRKLDVLRGLMSSCNTVPKKQLLEDCRREFPN
ncbi:hypothetical protein DOE51_03475 [Bdellovibrio sp. NC01]|nr:hypothetical protein DOE51_03475 [Bdellovibrio sp. NC01]